MLIVKIGINAFGVKSRKRDQPIRDCTASQQNRIENNAVECNQAFYHAAGALRKPYGDVN
jgi:hypothetical protein